MPASTDHASFTIERSFAHPPERIWRAFADPAAKTAWFVGPDDWGRGSYHLDFRVGGGERLESVPPDGPSIVFESRYFDIVPGERIVYGYDMLFGDDRLSVSLASIELRPTEDGTHVTLTEHGIFLDGRDTSEQRRRGTEELLDQLTASLDR